MKHAPSSAPLHALIKPTFITAHYINCIVCIHEHIIQLDFLFLFCTGVPASARLELETVPKLHYAEQQPLHVSEVHSCNDLKCD